MNDFTLFTFKFYTFYTWLIDYKYKQVVVLTQTPPLLYGAKRNKGEWVFF